MMPSYQTYAELHGRLLRGEDAAALEDVLPGLAGNLETANEVSAKYWTDSVPLDGRTKACILPERVLDALRAGAAQEFSAGESVHEEGNLAGHRYRRRGRQA